MTRSSLRLLIVAATFLLPGRGYALPPADGADPADGFGDCVGSTPCGEPFGKLFDIPPPATPPVRWSLTFYQDPKTKAPTTYKLRAEYDGAAPPAARRAVTKEKEGRWAVGKATKSDPNAAVYELTGAVPFLKLSDDVIHPLNPDRSPAVGTAGWSYTLYLKAAAEKVVVPSANWLRKSESYTLSPLASGPTVYGIFEGRSPAQGIARQLKIATEADRNKIKWRVTLYQNAGTKAPTTYKVENSFLRQGRREGTWTVLKDAAGGPTVFHLSATETEADLYLLKGDDNVLFFLDKDRRPLAGNTDFSYTLNRREPPKPGR